MKQVKKVVKLPIDDYNEIMSILRNLRRSYFISSSEQYTEMARNGIEKIGRILTYHNEIKEEDE